MVILTFDASTNTLNCPNLNGSLTGNAGTATLSTNVVGAANRVLFNNAIDTTTTSGNFTYDGTQLNVAGNIRANGIRLGFTDGTTIDTVTGDLKLKFIKQQGCYFIYSWFKQVKIQVL